jgi:two-component system OmpR family sensor kinase
MTTFLTRARDVSARMPLRVRLVLLILGLLAMALVVTGIAGPALLRRYLVQRVDIQLAQTVGPAAGDCSSGDTRDENPHGAALLNGYYTQCFDRFGQTVGEPYYRKPYLEADNAAQSLPNLPVLDPTAVKARLNQPFTVSGQNGGADWEVLIAFPQQPFRAGDPPPAPVLVALSLDETDRIVNQLVLLEVIVAAMVLVLVALLAYVLIRSSLRPLVKVEQTAEAIAAGDLTRRVPETDPRTEVGGLAQALNVMLGQIETAFEERRLSEESARSSEARMRRFIADASHELRTPLTSIRGFAELYRQNGGDDPEVNRIIERIEHHATRMGLLVEDLLLLARMDQQRPVERKPVDLLALATDAVIDARVTAPDHVLRLKAGAAAATGQAGGVHGYLPDGVEDDDADAPVVLGDSIRLRQVVGNLVTNALIHTPPGTEVTVTVWTESDNAILEVADDGPGMKPDDATRVFERFYRSDPSRTRTAGGSGLGLSIVAALVRAHDGEVTLSTVDGEGATFRVRLPLLRHE